MPTADAVFLAIASVLIAAWTAYNICVVRKGTRLWREIEKKRRDNDTPTTD